VRALVALGLLVASLVTLVLAASGVLNRPQVRDWLARRAAEELSAALAQPVRVGDARVSLLPPRLALREISLGPEEGPTATVRVAEVAIGKVRVAEREVVVNQLRIAGVRLRGELPQVEAKPVAAAPWIDVHVRQLEVEDVQIDRVALPGGVTLRAEEVDARWSGSPRAPIQAAVLRARGVTAVAPGIAPTTFDLVAWGKRQPAGFEVRRLRASGRGWRLAAAGQVAGTGARLRGDAELELAELDDTLRIGAGLAGPLRAHWQATVESGGFTVEASVESPRLRVVGFEVGEVAGEVLVTREGVEGSLQRGGFAGGIVSGTYTLAGLGPPWRHRVVATGEGVSLAAFLDSITVPPAGLSARCRMSAEVEWQGTRIREGLGTAIVDLAPGDGDVPLGGQVALSLEGDGALRSESRGLLAAGAPAAWDGRLLLGSWIPTWTVRGESVPIRALARLLAGWVGTEVLPPLLDGLASFDVRLRGPFDDLTVVGDVDAAPVGYGPVAVDDLSVGFRVADGAVEFEDGRLALGTGQASVSGRLDLGDEIGLGLAVRGAGLPLRRVVGWTGVRLPLAGTVAFHGSVSGTLGEPRVDLDATFRDVVVAGVPFGDGTGRAGLARGVLQVEELGVGPFDSRVVLDFARRRASLRASLKRFGLEGISPLLARLAGSGLDLDLTGEFPFDAPAGHLQVASQDGASGTVTLDPGGLTIDLTRPGVWQVGGATRAHGTGHRGTFTYRVESLGELATSLAGGDLGVAGSLVGRADVAIERGRQPVVEGSVESLHAVVNGDEFELVEPTAFTVRGDAVRVERLRLAGASGTLEARFARAEDGALDATASGRLPVSLVGLLWPEGRLGGSADVTVRVSGTDRRPVIVGSARVSDGSILLPGLPAPLTHVDGDVDFVPEGFRLRDVEFALGSGRGRGNGRVVLAPSVELDLETEVRGLRWPVFSGFTPSVTGSVRVVGPLDDLTVSGDTALEPTVFREEINIQRLVLQEILGTERAIGEEPGAVALNLQVAVPRTLEIDTALARVTMRGQLRVLGTSVQPGLVGQLEIMPGGELEFSGQRYELERGTITFSDPDRINPYLDLVARANVQSVEITVGLLGTLDRMTPTLVSNPPLPETDILALLSTGRRADQASEAQAGVLAGSFLTEQIAGAFARRARTLLDVDQLRVDPFAATETGSPTARVTVVKQLSSDWTVTVSSNLAANREEVIQSRWRLGQGMFLQASRDIDGSYSLEVKWQRRY